MTASVENYILLSLGAAINFPILAIVISTLNLSQGKKAVTYLLIGSELVLLAIGIIGLILAPQFLDFNIKHNFSQSFDKIIGFALLFLALYNTYRKPTKKKEKTERGFSNWRYLGMGIILTVTNLNTIVLYVAVLKNIIQITEDYLWQFSLLVISNTVINMMIIIPLIAYMAFPSIVESVIGPINNFSEKHKKTIVSIILFLLSGLFLYRGFLSN